MIKNNPLGLQTKPQTFLKEEKGFGKVHQGREAEDNRSHHLLLQTSHHGLMELGYPNERHTLASWYRVYEQKGEVKDKGREETKLSHVYSVNQVHGAVRFSMSKGKASVRPLKL